MEILTFDKLPEAISKLLEKVNQIEALLAGQQQQPGQDDLFTITQAAKFLNLAVPTLYSKVSRKEIPVNKQGKRLYFYKSELEEWIKKGRKHTFNELRENIQLPRKSFSSRRK
ncbi:MAG TPA: helix-turn-helix domain-containing protein [Hanamia sp.]